jgi:hypothetical protein
MLEGEEREGKRTKDKGKMIRMRGSECKIQRAK